MEGGRQSEDGRAAGHRVWLTLGLVALSGMAIVVMLVATRDGSGLTSDSLIYINASRNLLAGRGLSRLSGVAGTKPITHYPPLYSLMIAGLMSIGIGDLAAVRALGAVAFGANVFLVGVSIWAMTRRMWPSLAGPLLILVSPVMIDMHSSAMSEPPYIAFGLATCLLLHAYAKSRRMGFLVAAGGSAACAALTRYVGLSIIVAGVLALALDSSRPAKHTLRDLTVFGTLGLLPIIAWMVRNVAVTGSASNRGLAWHPPPITVLKKPFALIWEWLSPTVFTYTAFVAIAAASLAIVFTLLIQAWRRGWRPRWRWARALPWLSVGGVLALYVLVYAATVATSLVLFDANTPIDQRIASPISISIVALATAGLGMAVARSRSRAARRLGWLLFLLLAGSYLVRSASLVERLSREGRGYAGPELGASGHVEFIRALPGNLLIYTNSFAPLEFFYGRGSYTIPLPGDPVTGQAVASYADDLLTMRRRIMEGEAVMVLFFASPGEGRIPLELGHGLTLLCGENGVRLYVGDGYRGPRECGP